MVKKTPLGQVKEIYGSKEKLIDTLMEVIDRRDESKDALRSRLSKVHNAKLLRLLKTTNVIREQFGSKEKLIDALLALKRQEKDGDFREKLLSYSSARLFDLYRSQKRRSRAA